jgi:adenosylhomocysteine nucleosidase
MNAERETQGGVESLVCFAMDDEARIFRRIVGTPRNVLTLVCGIGRRNAERSIRDALTRHLPKQVLTCGFAGGLDPGLKTGDAIFCTEDIVLREKLAACGAKPATFHCSDRIATTVAEKQQLWRETGADAVEMESAVIHTICAERGIPCATLRVISDTATEDLPLDFNQLANADMSLNYGKLALAILKAPGKIPALKRLHQSTSIAAKVLAEVLAKVV